MAYSHQVCCRKLTLTQWLLGISAPACQCCHDDLLKYRHDLSLENEGPGRFAKGEGACGTGWQVIVVQWSHSSLCRHGLYVEVRWWQYPNHILQWKAEEHGASVFIFTWMWWSSCRWSLLWWPVTFWLWFLLYTQLIAPFAFTTVVLLWLYCCKLLGKVSSCWGNQALLFNSAGSLLPVRTRKV